MIVPEDHAKTLMNLTYGEATKANGYAQPDEMFEAIKSSIDSDALKNCTAEYGDIIARQAVVNKYSNKKAMFTADDVIITSGA